MAKRETLCKRSDGLYQKTVTDQRTGKRIYFYGKTKAEVMQKLLAYRDKVEKGRTFSEVAGEWWEEAEPRLAYQTVKSYRPALERALCHFGEVYVREIRPKDIKRFLMSLDEFSDKSISNQRMIINLILNHAVLEDDLEINPCVAVRIPGRGKRERRQAASKADEAIVRSAASVWLLPFFALCTGMRKGELLALQWKDVHIAEGYIEVTKSVYHVGDRPEIKLPKTAAGVRTVPILAPLKKRLLEIKQGALNDYIFSDTGKTPLTDRRYTTLYSRFQKETGVTCTAHQLRHSFATIAFECGVPVKSIQEILGHKQLSTTMDIYTDFRKSSIDEAASLLNSKLDDV